MCEICDSVADNLPDIREKLGAVAKDVASKVSVNEGTVIVYALMLMLAKEVVRNNMDPVAVALLWPDLYEKHANKAQNERINRHMSN